MDKGKIIERGSPRQLLNKHFSEVFIYLPLAQVPNELVQEKRWQVVGERVEITTKQVEATLLFLIEQQVSLDGLHVKSANLDDLFLKLTGHVLGSELGENK
jgi:ABC-2 type transport system ATP-binding protein